MADYKRIIRSSPRTLLVGKDHARLTIHTAAVQNISESLYTHICDDSMKASPSEVTVLEDVEADTFIGFCEYVYTGAYVTPDVTSTEHNEDGLSLETQAAGGTRSRTGSETISTPGSEFEAEDAGIQIAQLPNHPLYKNWDRLPKGTKMKRRKQMIKKKLPVIPGKDLVLPLPVSVPLPKEPVPVEESEPELPETKSVPVPETNNNNKWREAITTTRSVEVPPISPYGKLWERFRALEFPGQPASLSTNPDLVFHVKVYIFATRFRIEPLRQQCLTSIHRDLCNFSVNRNNVSQILDLLDFTYAHTGRYEFSQKSPIRDLVIHYADCEARALAENEKLTGILDSNSEMGSDFVMKLVK
ncbi:hypothetical protein BDV36DRAFT_256707 [Aspergillus pseudocaelatus]|uniref:BTB domain-containing protein n=1 Tax=Aspergillus pseudocaelatus TaxID=1825620 RepID=A0ABQ6WK94_9EURO|nr:hypothetical protein BDV36DRAFT_256707 [Aspergillus pseudocaelatus]